MRHSKRRGDHAVCINGNAAGILVLIVAVLIVPAVIVAPIVGLRETSRTERQQQNEAQRTVKDKR